MIMMQSINRLMGHEPREDSDEPEFGTSTGRQGIFNPTNPRHKSMAIQRLKELEESYGERLNPRFTGYTGLASNDAVGYAKMLNARTEAANIKSILGGGQPMNIRYGGTIQEPKRSYRPTWNPMEGQSSAVGEFVKDAPHKSAYFRRRPGMMALQGY